MNNPLIPPKFFSAYLADNEIPRYVVLGRSVNIGAETTAPVFVLEDEHRSEHMYVCGVTKSGKTRFLENLVVQDIALNHPVCVIDPTGNLYAKALNFIAHCVEECRYGTHHPEGFSEAEIDQLLESYLFLNLDDPENPVRMNPLEPHPDETTEESVDDILKTAERLFGSVDETRRLRQTLRNTLWVLTELNRLPEKDRPPLPEGHEYELNLDFASTFLASSREQRDSLVRAIPNTPNNRYVRQFWLEFFARHQPHQAQERLESTWNVLQYFLGDTLVRRFFDCKKSTFHVSELLKEKKSLFCHLPLGKNLKGSQLVGTFLATKFQHSAYRRPLEERLDPYYLFVDEFHEFADEQYAKASATLRQYGLHMVNAHQSQDQPPFHTAEGKSILETIKGNAGIKVLFRLSRKDAEVLSKEMFELTQRKFHFTYAERSTSFAEATGTVRTVTFQTSRGNTKTWTRATTEALGRTDSYAIQHSRGTNIGKTLTEGVGRNTAEALSRSISVSESRGITEVWSKSEGISVAVGEGWSQMIDHKTGFTYSENGTESLAVLRGQSQTHTEGEQEGETKTKGGNFSVTDTQGNNLTSTRGKSVAFHQTGESTTTSSNSNMSKLTQKARAQGQNYSTALQKIKNVSDGFSQNNSRTHTQGAGFSGAQQGGSGYREGISGNTTLTANTTMGRQKGLKKDVGMAETQGDSRTITATEQRSLSESFGVLKQFSESMTEAIQHTVSIARSRGSSQSETLSRGHQKGSSQTLTKTESSSEKTVFFTLDGERELGINILQKLPRRHCVISKTALAAQEIETLFVPDGYFSQWDEDVPNTLIRKQRLRLTPKTSADVLERPKEVVSPFQNRGFGTDGDPFEF